MTNQFSCFNNNLNNILPLENIINEVITINDCDFIVRPRTEKGWTIDLVFNNSGQTWVDNNVFYYFGIKNETVLENYVDNNLSFSLTSDHKIKWTSYKYIDVNQYKTISDETIQLCDDGIINDFNITITFDRYYEFKSCELINEGGTNDLIIDSIVTNPIDVISGSTKIVTNSYGFDKKWVKEKYKRYGVLKIYFNGKPIYKKIDWEEIIPSERNSENPLVQIWGTGTTGYNDIHNGICSIDIKEINYYEEPLSYIEINKLFQEKNKNYNFTQCNSCVDVVGIL